MTDNLTDKERAVFTDTAIESAYQAWVEQERKNSHMPNVTRKQFLLRVRALFRSGALA